MNKMYTATNIKNKLKYILNREFNKNGVGFISFDDFSE